MYSNILHKIITMHQNGIVHYDLKCDNILVLQKKKNQKNHNEQNEKKIPNEKNENKKSDTNETNDNDNNNNNNIELRLVDFGEAHVNPGYNIYNTNMNQKEIRSILNRGTECIKSPEMLTISGATDQNRPQHDRRKTIGTNALSDVWSLGCLLYELIVGDYLFRDEDWSRFYVRLTSKRGQQLISDTSRSKLLIYGEGGRKILDFLQTTMLIRDPRMRPNTYDVLTKFNRVFHDLLHLKQENKVNNKNKQQQSSTSSSLSSLSSLSSSNDIKNVLRLILNSKNKINETSGNNSSSSSSSLREDWSCVRIDNNVAICYHLIVEQTSKRSSVWKDVAWMSMGGNWTNVILGSGVSGDTKELKELKTEQENKITKISSKQMCVDGVIELTEEKESRNVLLIADGTIDGLYWVFVWCIEWLVRNRNMTMKVATNFVLDKFK